MRQGLVRQFDSKWHQDTFKMLISLAEKCMGTSGLCRELVAMTSITIFLTSLLTFLLPHPVLRAFLLILHLLNLVNGYLELVRQHKSFNEAEDYCVSHGGHLASIHSQAENDNVQAICIAGGYDCWLGLTLRNSSSFQWTDGTAADYYNWGIGEPSSSQHCVKMISRFHDGKWSDENCIDDGFIGSYFICNLSGTQPPATTTSSPTATQNTTGWSPHKLRVDSDNAHFTLNGTRVFLSGINQAWNAYAYDFGNNQYQYRRSVYEKTIQQMQQAGGNSIRVWIHMEGETSPEFDSSGRVIATDKDGTLISDLREYIQYAAQHNVMVFLTLWNAAVKQSAHYRIDGLIQDTAKLQTYIDNALIPIVQALKDEPGLGGWDIINEFEGQLRTDVTDTEPCFDTTFLNNYGPGWAGKLYTSQQFLRFINYQVDAIRRTDPYAQVTAGAWNPKSTTDSLGGRNLYKDECLLKAGKRPMGTLTFYSVHSYDWNRKYDDLQPFRHNFPDYGLDKPMVIAEFNQKQGAGMTMPEQFQMLYHNGYAGAWSWSYTDESWSAQEAGMRSISTWNNQREGGRVTFPVV